ncbi:hypothetical protein CEE36_07330 [candidate division TA06 bacterium B3_TA06]|uniref:Uncharacterized protein n=1 Tax=candidate division TA06 bacterium B3_TA06 TaxID=2012487 RepID=A0A532V4F6_UNCT6|nr:MAG: hypothetical protein CEE36_07330 [candidate division TA06 bacterium B3_TA06]
MKKVLLVLMALVVIGMASEMFLVEKYIEGDVECSLSIQKILEVTFTLDQPSYLLISCVLSYSNYPDAMKKEGWFNVNGEKQRHSASEFNLTYMMSMDSGRVVVQSWVRGGIFSAGVCTVRNPTLQVMVFCPSDEEPFVTEAPPESSDGLSSHSILSSGPLVHVEGCSEIYDIVGNKVDCEINDGDVYLNQLPAGTYFAKGSEGRTTKIVKLK